MVEFRDDTQIHAEILKTPKYGYSFLNTEPAPKRISDKVSPGAPPAPVRLSGQNFFEEKFSPFQWTGRWKFATNGGSWQHFYTRLNALKSAQIERREDSKTHSVAKIGENGVFVCKSRAL